MRREQEARYQGGGEAVQPGRQLMIRWTSESFSKYWIQCWFQVAGREEEMRSIGDEIFAAWNRFGLIGELLQWCTLAYLWIWPLLTWNIAYLSLTLWWKKPPFRASNEVKMCNYQFKTRSQHTCEKRSHKKDASCSTHELTGKIFKLLEELTIGLSIHAAVQRLCILKNRSTFVAWNHYKIPETSKYYCRYFFWKLLLP